MIKLVVAYGPPEDAAAFDEHYASTHAPLAQKIPGLRHFEAGGFATSKPGKFWARRTEHLLRSTS